MRSGNVMASVNDKAAALSKKYGSNFIKPKFYPTGSVILDLIFGGGLPEGVKIEIASDSGVGKTTTILHMAKILCSLGKKVVYLDYEKGVNHSQLEGVGLLQYLYDDSSNPNGLFFLYQVTTFEEGEEILDSLLPEGDISVVCVDSATAMLPGKFVAEDPRKRISVTDVEPGLQARIMSIWLQKYKSYCAKFGTTMIYINQMRTKINFRGSYNDSAGGNALRFFMDIRLRMAVDKELVKATDTIEGRKSVPYGADVKVWALKNRYAPPFVEGIITVFFGKGISNISSYIRWMKNHECLDSKGKKVKMITQGNAGYYTIYLDGQEHKTRGESGLLDFVKNNIKSIKEYVNKNGGFKLIQGEGSEDD